MTRIMLSPDLTLYSALRRVIAAYPQRAALVFEGQTLTYRELGERIDTLAAGLRSLGVGLGDKVAVILPNCLEFVYAFFAPAPLGAVVVPINSVYRQKEIQHILKDCEASVVITETRPMGNNMAAILEAALPALPEVKHIIMRGEATAGALSLASVLEQAEPFSPEEVSADALCALIYTSGTTGVPKAVMQSHRSMIAAARYGESTIKEAMSFSTFVKLMRTYDMRFLRWGLAHKTVLSPTAMHTLVGYAALIYGLLYGFRVAIADRFHPAKVLALIEREHVNVIMATPTMVAALLASQDIGKHNLSSLLYVTMGAAPCPPDLVRRARKTFGCPVVIAFGATEIGGVTLMTRMTDSETAQTETIGRLLPGIEAKVVDEQHREVPRGQTGELAMRLPSVMLGYYGAPELNAQVFDQDGWYYTGDLATMDEQGLFRIVGRQKDLIIRGGQNVYPAEIENHLIDKPGILNVSVVGVPDQFAGERIWAFVVPRADAQLTPAVVQGYCRGELAPFKVPDEVRLVEELPMTSTGKVQKFLLRERAMQEG